MTTTYQGDGAVNGAGDHRRGSRAAEQSAGSRAASAFLLSVLVASCASNKHTGAAVSRNHITRDLTASQPPLTTAPVLTLARVTSDARGVRTFSLSDGSTLVIDPLEPFREAQETQ